MKTKKRKYIIGNLYDEGGYLQTNKKLNSSLQSVNQLGQMAVSAYNAATPDTTKVESSTEQQLEELKKAQQSVNASSTSDLLSQWSSYKALDNNYNFDDYYAGKSNGQIATGAMSGALSGATTGASFGPWGAAAGAIIGAGSSLIGDLTGKKKATDTANESIQKLKEQQEITNQYNMGSFAAAAQGLNTKNMQNARANIAAFGGQFDNGITQVNNGGTHEQNPMNGVQMGIGSNGQPNLVEQGEVVWNDYVFSNRLKVPEEVAKKYNINKKNISFAKVAKKLQKESEERPNDPISKKGLDKSMGELANSQEEIKNIIAQKQQQMQQIQNAYALGGDLNSALFSAGRLSYPNFDADKTLTLAGYNPQVTQGFQVPNATDDFKKAWYNLPEYGLGAAILNNKQSGESSIPQEQKSMNLPTKGVDQYLRYAPVLGSALLSASDALGITNKPDYSYADNIDRAASIAASKFGKIGYNPLGNYLAYNPLDRNYYANQLAAQSAATNRGIINNAGGNRGNVLAGLLASQYNSQEGLGKLYRQGEEYNADQRMKVATFNRETDKFNSENDLRVQTTNASMDKDRANLLYEAAIKSNALREQEDLQSNAAKSANWNALFDNLGALGTEAYNRYDRNSLLNSGHSGTLNQSMLDRLGIVGDKQTSKDLEDEDIQGLKELFNNLTPEQQKLITSKK